MQEQNFRPRARLLEKATENRIMQAVVLVRLSEGKVECCSSICHVD